MKTRPFSDDDHLICKTFDPAPCVVLNDVPLCSEKINSLKVIGAERHMVLNCVERFQEHTLQHPECAEELILLNRLTADPFMIETRYYPLSGAPWLGRCLQTSLVPPKPPSTSIIQTPTPVPLNLPKPLETTQTLPSHFWVFTLLGSTLFLGLLGLLRAVYRSWQTSARIINASTIENPTTLSRELRTSALTTHPLDPDAAPLATSDSASSFCAPHTPSSGSSTTDCERYEELTTQLQKLHNKQETIHNELVHTTTILAKRVEKLEQSERQNPASPSGSVAASSQATLDIPPGT